MSDETLNEQLPVANEVDVIDEVDDQSIVEMLMGQMIQNYVYSFNKGGRVVEGFTLDNTKL